MPSRPEAPVGVYSSLEEHKRLSPPSWRKLIYLRKACSRSASTSNSSKFKRVNHLFGQKPESEYRDQAFDIFASQLQEAVRKPSIAAQDIGMPEAAERFRALTEHYGISARVIPTTGGYPCVYGEVKGKSDRTVLFYNRYDV